MQMSIFQLWGDNHKTPIKSKFSIEQHYLNKRFKNVLGQFTPQVSIIIVNLGLSGNEKEIIDLLPSSVALALTSYFKIDVPLLTKAKSRGHEIYLTIPAPSGETPGEVDPFVMNSDNFKRWISGLNKEYQGLVFEQPIDGMPFYIQNLVELLNESRAGSPLTLIMIEPSLHNTMLSTCQENKFQCAMGDKVIYRSDTQAIRIRKMNEALNIAKLTGRVVMSVSIRSIEMARELAQWLAQIKKEDKVNIVPLSKMMITPRLEGKAPPHA